MAKSNHLETSGLEYWLTTTAVGSITITARPTEWFVGLFTEDPTDAGTGAEVDTTVDDTAYARQQENAAGFTVSGDSATNQNALVFPACVYGTGAAPYDVTHVGIFDAVTGGNLLYHGALDSSKNITVGDQADFAIGDLTIVEN